MSPIFDDQRTDAAYARWENRKINEAVHEEDGCMRCHEVHCEEGIFNEDCEFCESQKCLTCDGKGYMPNDDECEKCHARGWVLEQ